MSVANVLGTSGICHGIYNGELSLPVRGVEKLPQVESIIIRRVSLCMISWSYRAHLVPIDGIVVEEAFYLGGNFVR